MNAAFEAMGRDGTLRRIEHEYEGDRPAAGAHD
jgi:hypothetical protein